MCARVIRTLAHATTLFSREGNLYGAVLSERLVILRNLISALVHELRSAVQMTRSSKTTRTLLGGLDKSTACGRTSEVRATRQPSAWPRRTAYAAPGDSAGLQPAHGIKQLTLCSAPSFSTGREPFSGADGCSRASVCAWHLCPRVSHRQTQAHWAHVGVWLATVCVATPAKRLCCGVELDVCFKSNDRLPRLRHSTRQSGCGGGGGNLPQASAKRASVDEDATALSGRSIPRARPDPRSAQLKPRRVRGAQRAGHRTTKRRKRGGQHLRACTC
jgi:hypothetical protein